EATNRLESLKEAENIFKANANNSVGIETYLELGNYFLTNANSDSALLYFEKARHLSNLLNDRFYTARSEQELGKYYLTIGDTETARNYATSAKDIYTSMKDTFWLLQQLNFMADLEIAEGNLEKGIQLYTNVISKGLKTRDSEAISIAYYNIAKIQILQSRFDEAFKNLKTSKSLFSTNKYRELAAKINNKLGFVYIALGMDSLSYHILNESLELNSANNPEILSETNLFLASFFQKIKKLDMALSSIEKSIELAGLTGNESLYLSGINKKADILYNNNQLTESKNLIEKNQDEIQKTQDSGIKAEYYEIYSRILYQLGDINDAAGAAAIAYEEARKSRNLILKQKSAFTLGQVMNERGQFISASRFLLLSNQFKDSLAIIVNNEILKNEINKYEHVNSSTGLTANRESTRKNKSSIFSKDDSNNRIQNLLIISIVLLVILISFFSILIFKGYKSNRKLYNDLSLGKSVSGKNDELEKLAVLNNKIFSVISHDLRSPIISIKDSIDFLRQEELDEETKKEALVLSEELAEATLNLLDNLLGWAKNQKKKVDPKKVPVKILDEINQIEYLFKSSLAKKEINFTVDCDENVVALADNELINLALRNLISNAVKFTPRGGNIHISGSSFDNKIVVSVKDTGIGISKEDQSKILSPDLFFTKNGTENESGSGIGLKLVNEFVKIMGGELKIESIHGQGSKFLFTLPEFIAKKNPKSTEPVFKHTIN
ncbi:MAG: tetratricopeptide repeat-containing sensor histidine kinase, partial [Prolixibacteraceae bacterium]|nr:tetratricopeptide repeat-containing sensor histidine kinase [Prolixibacteraceae bacterium]